MAIMALGATRSRSRSVPSTTVERQRRDWRLNHIDSSKPAAVLATIDAVSNQQGVDGAAAASGGVYYYKGGPSLI